MNYIILTPSAKKLKDEILSRVSAKVDGNGIGITSWQCVETDNAEKTLVLTEGKWAEKGCITLAQVVSRNELQVKFHYWDSCTERDNADDKFVLGRFTELILVHFSYFVDKIVIE